MADGDRRRSIDARRTIESDPNPEIPEPPCTSPLENHHQHAPELIRSREHIETPMTLNELATVAAQERHIATSIPTGEDSPRNDGPSIAKSLRERRAHPNGPISQSGRPAMMRMNVGAQRPTSLNTTPPPMETLVFCINDSSSIPRPARKRKGFSEERRQNVAEMRKIGACAPCRGRKVKVCAGGHQS
jgi:hypothetical protein